MENGWKPLPLSLKILFVYLAYSVLSGVFSLAVSFQEYRSTPTFILGQQVVGDATMIFMILTILINIFLLFWIWSRISWAWVFGTGYYLFSALNILLIFPNVEKLSELVMEKATAAGLESAAELTSIMLFIMLSISLAIAITIALVFYLKRGYFENKIVKK